MRSDFPSDVVPAEAPAAQLLPAQPPADPPPTLAAPAAGSEGHPGRVRGSWQTDWRRRVLLCLPAVLAAWLAYSGTLRYGLLADARFLIADNAWLRHWSDLPGNLVHDYFWSSSGQTIPYWRPLTKASWLLEWLAGGGDAAVFHGVQLLWWSVAASGVVWLALELGASPLWAALSGVAAALHPAAAEPVSLVMARSDVVATAAAVWCLALAVGSLRRGGRTGMAAATLFLTMALASKEAAIGLVAVLVVWQLRSAPAAGWRSLRPLMAPVLVSAGYLLLRAWVLAGYAQPAVAWAPLRWLAGLGIYAQGLFPGRMETAVANLPEAAAAAPWLLATAVLALLLWLAGMVWAWRHRHGALVPLLWMAVSLAPVLLVSQLHVPNAAGKIPLADRWLLPSAVALQVLFALALSRLRRPWLVRSAAVGVVVWLAARLAAAPDAHASYADEVQLMALEERNFQRLPPHLRSLADRCRSGTRAMVTAGQRGDPAQVIALAAAQPEGCRSDPEQQFNLLAALVATQRHREAVQVGQRLLATQRIEPRLAISLRALLGRAWAAEGNCGEAEPLLADAIRQGSSDCASRVELGRCLQQRGAMPQAATQLEQAAACADRQGGRGGAGLWVLAAQARLGHGDRLHARHDLQQAEGRTESLPPPLRALARSLDASLQ